MVVYMGSTWNIHGMIGIINMIGITKLGSLLNQTINMFCLGGSINEGTRIAGWFIVDNPIYKWMRTGGPPILGNLRLQDECRKCECLDFVWEGQCCCRQAHP